MSKQEKEWDYNPLGERITGEVVSLSTAIAVGIGLSFVFNPVALGIAAAYGALRAGATYANIGIPSLRKRMFNAMAREGYLEDLPTNEKQIRRITSDISRQMERPEPPQIYIAKKKFAIKKLPWLLRQLPKKFLEKLLDKAVMHKIFAALPGTNTILVSKEALHYGYSKDEIKFVAAHEMSHLQVREDLSLYPVVEIITKNMTRALLAGGAAVLGLGLAGVTLPVALTTGMPVLWALGILYGGKLAVEQVLNFVSRIREKRADRNAVHITGDLAAAESALKIMHAPQTSMKRRFYDFETSTHPSFGPRIRALREAWGTNGKYTPPAGANDNNLPSPPQP